MIHGTTRHAGRRAAGRAWAAGTTLVLAGRDEAARVALMPVNGSTFTADAAAEAGGHALADAGRPCFQPPAILFGNGLAETIADTTIFDI